MVILSSQNKITDFLLILAWASPFNVTGLRSIGDTFTRLHVEIMSPSISLVNNAMQCLLIRDHIIIYWPTVQIDE